MNNKSRIENSIRNSASGIVLQGCSTVFGLVVRSFFIRFLSAEYLGVNGLFTNILTMLSLAEMGIGSAITYSMYKPIANNDERKIAQLTNLYRNAYRIIGTVVAVLGTCVIPFIGYIIKDKPNIEHLSTIYLLYLVNTVLSYFFAYKRSVLSADQLDRIINYFTLAFQIARYSLQILSLVILHDFISYLVVQIVCTFLENLSISIYVDRRYPFLSRYKTERLPKTEQNKILDNIKALMIYKIGSTALDGTDNIIISAFDGVISVGLLSNYGLITGSLQTFLNRMSQALTGSVGNYIAKKDKNSYDELLDRLTFLHFILYGLLFVGCMAILNPFISIWAGKGYVLSYDIVFVHCLNIYIYGMMNSVWLFRTTMGLFVYGKWRPLISAVINIVVSILLARKIGLLGVLLGTTITRITTNVWFDPYIVYKYGIKTSPQKYYKRWIEYLVVIIIDLYVVDIIKKQMPIDDILTLFSCGVISVIVFSISVIICFRKTSSLQYFKELCEKGLLKIKK